MHCAAHHHQDTRFRIRFDRNNYCGRSYFCSSSSSSSGGGGGGSGGGGSGIGCALWLCVVCNEDRVCDKKVVVVVVVVTLSDDCV